MNKYKKPHTEEELKEVFQQNQIDDGLISVYIDYYNVSFKELLEDHKDFKDEDWGEGESVQAFALWCANDYIREYSKHIENGHGEEWSHILAHSNEEGQLGIFHAYNDLRKINLDLAKKELLTYAKYQSEDKDFLKHYLHLFAEVSEPGIRIETAKKYAEIYKKELAKGKSEVFANEYAALIASGDYHEIYCEDYAIAFDIANKENRDIEYARLYADKYASALIDIKRRYGISDDEDMMNFAIEKVKAYMKAWNYARENRLEDFKRFADIYENIHLNTYYADEGRPNKSELEIDKEILERALEKFGE